jgi:hypothetical protein
LKDDIGTALALFSLLNIIIESMITKPLEIEELYGKLPKALAAINRRDSKK